MVTCDRHIHCIGIGGAGMCGLAEILLSMGCAVSGSDREHSAATERLESLGMAIQYGHDPTLVKTSDLVIYSSAIRPDSPERLYALQNNIPQIKRGEAVGDLMRSSVSIAIAGTHGKTTTTALTGHVLRGAGRTPTVIVGGTMPATGSNAAVGQECLLVVEADEFDRSFLSMYPTVAVITNIESEHLDCYGDFESVKKAFTTFANRIPFYGCVIACADDPGVRSILPGIRGPVVTYGFDGTADFRIESAEQTVKKHSFSLGKKGETPAEIRLAIPGRHNMQNAAAAVAAAYAVGVPLETAGRFAESFAGVRRRFEVVGTAAGITVIDDYAHHPGEIRATLAAARTMGYSRIAVVFQPHLFTRTRDLQAGFIASLAEADMVFVTAIYQSREDAIPGITGESIVSGIRARGHANATYVENMADIPARLAPQLKKDDAVILMGAGDVWKIGPQLIGSLRHAA